MSLRDWQRRKRESYKRDWQEEESAARVEWRGYLEDEKLGKEVPMGWCSKQGHYVLWEGREKHILECEWRANKYYKGRKLKTHAPDSTTERLNVGGLGGKVVAKPSSTPDTPT